MSSQKHIENRNDYQTPDLVDYIRSTMAVEDDRHRYILDQMRNEGLPDIQIGAMEGKLLQFLAQSCHAQKAVEIGTLGGYSALWIADALGTPAVRAHGSAPLLYTLEADPAYAKLASNAFKEVGIAEHVSVVVGDANETLKTIEPFGPFDFCFIDADKISYPNYLLWAARHLRKGGIVAADNAYLFGKVHLDANTAGSDAPAVLAMQKFIKILTDPVYFTSCAMIPTGEGLAVGVK